MGWRVYGRSEQGLSELSGESAGTSTRRGGGGKGGEARWAGWAVVGPDLACRAYCRTGGIVDRGEAILLPTWYCSTSTMAGDVPSTAVAGVFVVSVTRYGDVWLANFARLSLCHRSRLRGRLQSLCSGLCNVPERLFVHWVDLSL